MMLGSYAGTSNLAAQTPAQETLKEWVQTVLLTAAVAGHRHEDIAPHQVGNTREQFIPG